MMRIGKLVGATALAVLVFGSGTAAWAHSEFDPSRVTAGEVANLTLNLENEVPGSGTVKIDLRFPAAQPLIVVDVPAVDGWTSTVTGGSIGSEATGIVWERATASPDDDPAVTMELGPIPGAVDRLQFKVLQTYANGEVDSWIEDWPAGQPEPEMPGPVLEVEGATTATTSPTATTTAPTSTVSPSTASPTSTAAATEDDDDSNAGLIVAIVIAALVLGGGAALWAVRRRRLPPGP